MILKSDNQMDIRNRRTGPPKPIPKPKDPSIISRGPKTPKPKDE